MISLIVAIGKNNLIGKDNELPWHYSEDMKFFRETTRGKSVVMGSKTFFSIGKPLPNRCNYVVTKNKDFKNDGVIVINDLIKFIDENKKNSEEIFIIGGRQIYELSLPYVDKMYITHVNKEYEGNVFFPSINYDEFNKVSSKINGDLEFAVYERKC